MSGQTPPPGRFCFGDLLDIIDRWRNLPPAPPPTYDVIFMGETIASDVDERRALEVIAGVYTEMSEKRQSYSAPYTVLHVDDKPNP